MTTTMIECPECEGYGEVRHPRWGSRSCPEPTITCPVCRGNGEVAPESVEEHQDRPRPYTGPVVALAAFEGEEPF
jgi:DnaJ-class molecular chaperone